MQVVTFFSLSAEVKAAESAHQNNMAKAHNAALAKSTRAKYARQIAKSQRRMIEARAARTAFIESQRAKRV